MDKTCSVLLIISLIKVALSWGVSLNFKTMLKINFPAKFPDNAFDD